jgi:hypothetical protein
MSERWRYTQAQKRIRNPLYIINRWLNTKKVSHNILRYSKRKQGQVTLHFIRNFILCIALGYDCIPFITSIASSAEIIGLTLNLT